MADDSTCSSSDSDDQEYIPEGELPSSCSDVSEGDPEEGGERKGGRKKKTQKPPRRMRKRRGGAHLKEAPDNSEGEGIEEEEEEEEEEKEERKRARIDDLWASFKQNTGTKAHSATDTKITSVRLETGGTTLKPQTPRTVTIKETYDFAGEDVIVEKEVAADSKEALQFLKSHHDKNEGSQEGGRLLSTTTGERSSVSPSVVSPAAVRSSVASSSKRTSGLGSILQSLSKKPKMSTLEKSRLDWVNYKRDEGLEEELSQHKKDGYLERQEFLQQTDIRQFELEREERLKRFQRLK